MNIFLMGVCVFLIVALFVELLARLHYYLRKQQYAISERVKLVFFGRWLVKEERVHSDFMVEILTATSGKEVKEIRSLFLSDKNMELQNHLVPHIGFMMKPNQNVIHTTTNSLGFRGPDRVFSKPHNVKRIILLGGSVAFGHKATSDANTISAQLETLLNEQEQSGMRWEVINLASPGSGSYQELLILLTYGLKYQPDIVISFSGNNDCALYFQNMRVNEHPGMSKVTEVYNLYSGGLLSFLKLALYKLHNFFECGYFPQPFISVHYINLLFIKKFISEEVDEKLSPYTYTIW